MKKVLLFTTIFLTTLQGYSQTRDYTSLNELVVKFYGYQRAGLKTGSANNLNPGWANASHNGDNYNGTAVDGGWYDAGDYVKFGMNLGYSVYCLLKGYDVFPSGYSDKYNFDHSSTPNNVPDILDEVKFATDYMCKAIINDNTIILDVGIAQSEHGAMVRADDPQGRNSGEMITCSGADIPLTYAACLALMSTVYREFDAAYADQCLAKAKVAFNFGKKKIDAGGDANLYCKPQTKNGQALYDYYKDNGVYRRSITDRQVAAGVELYRATTNADPMYPTYTSWAKKNISGQFNCVGYAYIGPIAAFEVWRQGLGGDGALSSNIGFIELNIKTSGKFNGVYQNSGWGTAREIGSVAFEYALAYVTSIKQADRDNYKNKLKSHIDWITGWNTASRSYIVGFNNGPKNIHYRTTSSGPAGGLVSGPDGDGNWSDDASAEYCEVAIDYNAGIAGATAFLRALDNPGDGIQVTTPFSATPGANLDFSKQNVTFAAAFSKSTKWTLKIIGKSGTKTISKTGTTVNETWDGSADEGSFLAGETVTASISVEGKIVAYDISKITGVSMSIVKGKPVATTTSDVLFDDFEDNDLKNKFKGTWTAFGTTGGLGVARVTVGADENSPALKITGSVYTNDSVRHWMGAKTTFNEAGTPVNISSAKSIYFSLRGVKEVPVSVELIQPNITDSAYYRYEVSTTTLKNYYRVKLEDFKQPDWKKAATPINLGAISGIRFTIYDSVVTQTMNIDDIKIEGFNPNSSVSLNQVFNSSSSYLSIANQVLKFTLPSNVNGVFELTVFNIAGKVALSRSFTTKGLNTITLPFSKLPSGMYTVVTSLNGAPVGERIKIVNTR
jgi:hypothetical protein